MCSTMITLAYVKEEHENFAFDIMSALNKKESVYQPIDRQTFPAKVYPLAHAHLYDVSDTGKQR